MLTEIELQKKREHKRELSNRKSANSQQSIQNRNYSRPPAQKKASPAPARVVDAKPKAPGKLSGFFRRIFSRKV